MKGTISSVLLAIVMSMGAADVAFAMTVTDLGRIEPGDSYSETVQGKANYQHTVNFRLDSGGVLAAVMIGLDNYVNLKQLEATLYRRNEGPGGKKKQLVWAFTTGGQHMGTGTTLESQLADGRYFLELSAMGEAKKEVSGFDMTIAVAPLAPVPLPSAAILFGSALALLAVARRRGKPPTPQGAGRPAAA